VSNSLGITFDQVDDSYEGTIAADRKPWVENKIDEAVRELISKIPNILSRIDAGDLDPDLVRDKAVAAVLRVVRNPTGFEEESEGDYRYRLNPLVASGDIWYPEKDLTALGWVNDALNKAPRTVFTKASRGFGFP
jgi:hypothetical protein